MTPPTRHRGRPLTPETPLSARERAFVDAYVESFDGCQAAIQVGYKDGPGVHVVACRLLKQPHIEAAVDAAITIRQRQSQVRIFKLLRETDWLAHSDIGAYFDACGNLLPLHTLPRAVRAAIASVEIVKRNLTAGDGAVDTVIKFKLWDKGKAGELLAKMLGLVDGSAGVEKAPDVPAFALPVETPGVSVH